MGDILNDDNTNLELVIIKNKLIVTNGINKVIFDNLIFINYLKRELGMIDNKWIHFDELNINKKIKHKILDYIHQHFNYKAYNSKQLSFWVSDTIPFITEKLKKGLRGIIKIISDKNRADIAVVSKGDLLNSNINGYSKSKVFILIDTKRAVITNLLTTLNNIDNDLFTNINQNNIEKIVWSLITRAINEYKNPTILNKSFLEMTEKNGNINFQRKFIKTDLFDTYRNEAKKLNSDYLGSFLLNNINNDSLFSSISLIPKQVPNLVKQFGFFDYEQVPYKLVSADFESSDVKYFYVDENFYDAFNVGFFELLTKYISEKDEDNKIWIYKTNRTNILEALLKIMLKDKHEVCTKEFNIKYNSFILKNPFIKWALNNDKDLQYFLTKIHIFYTEFEDNCVKVNCKIDNKCIYEFYGVNINTEIERCLKCLYGLAVQNLQIQLSTIQILPNSSFNYRDSQYINKLILKSNVDINLYKWGNTDLFPKNTELYRME